MGDGRGLRRRLQRDQEDLHGSWPAGGGEEEGLLLRRGRRPGQQGHRHPRVLRNIPRLVELCKLYDKNENGTMMLAELENILSNLADEIPKEDTMALLAELADPEDEDGMFPYAPFLDRLTGKA